MDSSINYYVDHHPKQRAFYMAIYTLKPVVIGHRIIKRTLIQIRVLKQIFFQIKKIENGFPVCIILPASKKCRKDYLMNKKTAKIKALSQQYYDILNNGGGDTQQLVIDTLKKEILKNHPYEITKGTDNRWQTYVKDPDTGKRICVKGKTKSDIEAKLVERYKEMYAHIEKRTVDKMYHEWLIDYKTPRTESANTIKRHGQHYEKYLKGTALFKMQLDMVDKLTLESFCNKLVKDNNMTSHEYVNVKTIIKGLFEYAYDKGYIKKDPMETVRITVKFKQVAKKSGKTETYNSKEQEKLIQYLDEKYAETKDLSFLAVKLHFFIGLRIGELSALKWKDVIDMTHLHVEREEIRNQDTGVTEVVDHTKTRTDRTVLLVPKAYAVLNEVKTNGDAVPTEEGYIFTREGERLRARQIQYVLDKYQERSGMEVRKASHKIRKTYASNLSAAGVPIDEIREQLGHSNLSTTYKYIFNPLTEAETYERIKGAL